MRHGKKINHLGRTKPHRQAMLSNMACSLIQHKRINTTLAKAKALRGFVEPLITKSKTDNTHSRRVVFSYLNDKFAVSELFREVAPKVADRPGGYTRIIKTGNRLGDNAEMCMMELVDFNEIYTSEKEATKKKTRRRRGGSGKAKADSSTEATAKTETTATEAKAETAVAEEVKEESTEATAKVEAPKAEAPAKEEKAEEKVEAKKEEESTEASTKVEEPKAEKKEDSSESEEEKKD